MIEQLIQLLTRIKLFDGTLKGYAIIHENRKQKMYTYVYKVNYSFVCGTTETLSFA